MDTFPVIILSWFERKSTGALGTIKPITDTIIIQLFKSFFMLEIYSIFIFKKFHLTFYQQHWKCHTNLQQAGCTFEIQS